MLIERIKTSLWIPKIMFGSLIVLVAFSAILAYGYISVGASTMIEESLKMTDQLTYKVIANHEIIDSGSASDKIKATVLDGI
jgi:hypothetical protein